jgi:hypothetical protein
MLNWLPISPDEYKLVKWWMEIEIRGFDSKAGTGFLLRRRPTSVRSLLRRWPDVNDIARNYWKKYESRGHMHVS